MLNMYFLHKPALGPFKAGSGQLHRSYPSNPQVHSSRKMRFRDKAMFNTYFLRKDIFGP